MLVGNHQSGHINAFNPATGAFLGRLRDESGDVIQIDGLFALHFGNGPVSGDRDALYFAAAPDDGAHGLFGSLRVAAGAAPSPGRADLASSDPTAGRILSRSSGRLSPSLFADGSAGPASTEMDILAANDEEPWASG